MSALLQDLRYGARVLFRNPGFAVVAVVTLALGIGANTVIFSVVDAVLLRPLPYEHAERLVKVWGNFAGIGLPNNLNEISPPEFKDLETQNKSFSDIAAYTDVSVNLSVAGRPERVEGYAVSPSLFRLLGVQAAIGRTLAPDESQPGREKVVVLGHGLWKRGFGGDPRVLGRTVNLNGENYTIVGVMPAGFQYPDEAELWAPLAFAPADLSPNNRGSHGFDVIARIKPSITIAQARDDMAALTRSVMEQNRDYPYAKFEFKFLLIPLLDETVRDVKTALWVLAGAIALVLLIACANVASLLLVRASAREREIAIRMSLGAPRSRLVRQLLTESVLLSLIGGAAGLAVAYWGIRILVGFAATIFPRLASATLDGSVLAFTMLLSLGTGIAFGLAPAFQTSRGVRHEALKDSARSSTSRRGSQRLRQCLVAGEVALSLMLLSASGLLLKSFLRLEEVNPGFRSDHVLTMRFSLPPTKYEKPEQRRAFFQDVLERVSALPGVTAAGAVNALPLTGQGGSATTTIDTRAVPSDQTTPEADWRIAAPGYFQALGIPLVSGRYFDARDTDSSPRVVVIDETLANKYWPHEDAVGKRLHFGGLRSSSPWSTVVGVVKHVRYRTLEALSRTEVYAPATQLVPQGMSLVIRTAGDPRALTDAVRKEVLAVDPEQPIYRVRTMDELVEGSLARRRLSTMLLGLFAAGALFLSAVGIFGIISYWVGERTREMGIRMALGARRLDLLWLVVKQSAVLAGVGIAAGVVGSMLGNRLIASMLFNVTPYDPLTFISVALVLAAVALLASLLPARRATGVHPIVALRYE